MTVYKTIADLPAGSNATGSDLVEVSQGGTSRRLTIGQLAAAVVPSAPINVGDFGAVGDGVADDTAAIQAAIAAAGAAPCGTVLLEGKSYKITATLDIPYANVRIIGGGSDVAHTVAPQGGQAATKLVWNGADGGTMMWFRSPIGATAQALSGGGVTGIYFHCAGSSAAGANRGAAVGIRISSRRNGWYEDIFFEQPMYHGFLLDTVSQLGDDRGCHNNVFFSCVSRNTYSNVDGGFVKLEGDITVPPGEINANCYFNRFFNCRPVFNAGICYDLGNSDHNDFTGCSANCVNHSYSLDPVDATISLANPAVVATVAAHGFITGHCVQFISNSDTLPAPLAFAVKYYITVIDANSFSLSTTLADRVAGVLIDTSASSQAGTHKLLAYSGYGILFHGSNIDGHAARTNHFTNFSGGDVIYGEGTEGGLLFPSHHNIFSNLDYSNFTPQPTLGTGATASVLSRDDGTQPKGKFLMASFGGASLVSGTNSLLMDNVQARMTNESLRIANGGNDHIRLEVPTADYLSTTVEWGVAALTGGDLRILRVTGTGTLVSNTGIRGTSTTLGIGYATGAGGTVTQLTSKATLVNLNRVCGLITTFNDALAAGAVVTFQWNNSAMAQGDVVILNHDSSAGGTAGAYAFTPRVVNGGAFLTIRNLTAGSLSEAIGIRFAVIKGVVA